MTLIGQYITSAMLMSIATNDNYDFSKACCLEIDSLIFKLKEILHIYIYV